MRFPAACRKGDKRVASNRVARPRRRNPEMAIVEIVACDRDAVSVVCVDSVVPTTFKDVVGDQSPPGGAARSEVGKVNALSACSNSVSESLEVS